MDIRNFFAPKKKERAQVILSDDEEEPKPEKIKVDPSSFFTSKSIKQKKNSLVKNAIKENQSSNGDLASSSKEESKAKLDKTSTKKPIESKPAGNEHAEGTSAITVGERKLSTPIVILDSPVKEKSTDAQGNKEGKSKADPKPTPTKASNSADAEAKKGGQPAKFNYFKYAAQKAAHTVSVTRPEPVGAPNCLVGKTFVFTGDLNSLTRDKASDIVKRYGGKVTSAPSKKTSFVVVGEDPGPSKIKKCEDLGLKLLKEDEFYDYINSFGSSNETQNSVEMEVDQPVTEKLSEPTPKSAAKTAPKKKEAAAESVQKSDKGKAKLVVSRNESELWTEKYRPKAISEIVGNQGLVDKLHKWLQSWQSFKSQQFPKGELSQFRAALLSGPPGIGKTTSAHLAAKMAGFEVLEFNASDTRSKKSLQESVKEATISGSVMALFKKSANPKKVLIMDEVDGMSSGDRGGMAELIQIIKKSGIPIICICNERSSPKVRSLANHCLDLKFRRPTAQQTEKRLKFIAAQEGLQLGANSVGELNQATSGDIRQMLNVLSTYRLNSTSLSFDQSKRLMQENPKNVTLTPFDIIGKLLGQNTFRNGTINDKVDYYFQDYSLIPLMVQENYIKMSPAMARESGLSGKALNAQLLKLLAEAADSISMGDLLDSAQRSENSWTLLPLHAVVSTVRPCFFTHGSMNGMYQFPGWLGQNSKQGKGDRIMLEVKHKMSLKAKGDKKQICLHYLPFMVKRMTEPLIRGVEGVEEVIKLMDDYYLSKEDWDAIMDLGYSEILSKIDSKTKSAFTRMYNKSSHPSPFSSFPSRKSVSSSAVVPDCEDLILEEVIDEPEEEEELPAETKSSGTKKRKASGTVEGESSKKKSQKTKK